MLSRRASGARGRIHGVSAAGRAMGSGVPAGIAWTIRVDRERRAGQRMIEELPFIADMAMRRRVMRDGAPALAIGRAPGLRHPASRPRCFPEPPARRG